MVIFVSGCEEQYKPDINPASENLLVVDGMIHNLPGPYTIKLSMSTDLENPQFIPLSGFAVFILDDRGNSYFLPEHSTGEYVTEDSSFKGETGRSYKLEFLSPGGKIYSTSFEKLRQPTGIKEVYHLLEYQESDELNYEIAGYRFYVNTETAPSDTNYFMWQLISTYKYRADMGIYWIYDGELTPVADHDTLQICYKTDTVPDIFLLNTENISPPVISNFPLHYVTTETRHLMERYSLLVRQYSMSREAYKYWMIIREQNTNLDDLYGKEPFQVRGNVFNADDPDEIVLGQFMVAGVAEHRIFVDRPKPPVKMRYPICEFHKVTYENFGMMFEFPPSSWPLFATRGPLGNARPNFKWCLDCRESGGVLEKPEFWIDD
jgi:hypothetical protein